MDPEFEALSPGAVRRYLKERSVSDDVLEKILEHKIDGEVFLSLNDEHLREIAPLLGDRLKMKRVISETIAKFTNVSGFVLPLFLFSMPFPS